MYGDTPTKIATLFKHDLSQHVKLSLGFATQNTYFVKLTTDFKDKFKQQHKVDSLKLEANLEC